MSKEIKTAADLKQDSHNYRKHSDTNKARIKKSIDEAGLGRSVVIDADNVLVAGNGVQSVIDKDTPVRVVETDGTELVVVKRTDLHTDDPRRKTLALADNATADDVEWDFDAIADDWTEDEAGEWGVEWGNATQQKEKEKVVSLSERFIVPPFSILDSRKGYWQERKMEWRGLIGDNGESREAVLSGGLMLGINNGTSLLDPVMAEIVCRWFGFENCNTFDCFAGDTVFGYVSASLGNNFIGVELRKEQADLNNERTKDLAARYICDDGRNVGKYIEKESQDLFFSCPPYFDLEVYSDDPRDASNQSSYEDFLCILKTAFHNSIDCLKNERFAVVVVGDIRNKNGFYYDFVGDVKRIFFEKGVFLYNEAILVEQIGTLSHRVSNSMKNRKLGKCHQNVLVFYKGNPKNIQKQFNPITYESKDLELFGMDN